MHEKAGLTFASALRSILRQDPDVVLIGEIRDQETAQIALQASLTGHLVLSTLHTNDAPNAVTRLVDMGMEPYKIASALRGRGGAAAHAAALPKACGEPLRRRGPGARSRASFPPGTKLFRAVGCPECAHDRLPRPVQHHGGADHELRARAADRPGRHGRSDRRSRARTAGMRSLLESGLRHVLAGESTIEELLRVTDVPREAERARPRAADVHPAGARCGRPAAGRRPAPAAGPLADARRRRSTSTGLELVDEAPADEAPAPSGRGAGTWVLLVEDEDQLRRVMKDLLEREGYTVAEARDGVQALDQVDRFAPDIIVLDLNLPGLDGYSVLTQLRSRPATRAIPVMVLTAKGDEDNEVRVFELGADDFITKPFRARALSARLEAVLGRHRA